MSKILDFSHATEEEELAARRVSQKLRSSGEIFFGYNLPLQIFLSYKEDDKPESGLDPYTTDVLNYMPQRQCTEMESLADLFSDPDSITMADIKDLTIVTAAILRNLSLEMLKLGNGKITTAYYPNCKD